MAKAITETELSLLRKLWQQPSATVQELAQGQYGSSAPGFLVTVRKLLDRLEAKKYVTCDRSQWPHHYRALMKQEDLIRTIFQEVADQFYEGEQVSLLIHLIRSQKLTLLVREKLRKSLE